MEFNEKMYKKLCKKEEFASILAYGLYSRKEAEYISSKKDNLTDEQLRHFHEAELLHVDNYKNEAANLIQNLSNKITEENADKLLEKIMEGAYGKHYNWCSFGLNLLASFVWSVLLLVLGFIVYFNSDVFSAIIKECANFLSSNNI